MKNTSVSLDNYFDDFVQRQVSAGSYKDVSEVIRAGLRLMEDEESKAIALRNAIQDGIDSGIATDFNRDNFLKDLKLFEITRILHAQMDLKRRLKK